MKDSRRRALSVCIALAGVLLPEAQASKLRFMNLEEMTERAATIFKGRCTGVRVEHAPSLRMDLTVATFAVERSVKGPATGDDVMTIRQLGGIEVAGMPRFEAGEDVILFLYGESGSGLRSPVGFGQGKFTIRTDKTGRRVAINEAGNQNLLRGLSPGAQVRLEGRSELAVESPAVSPDDLLGMVETLLTPE